MSRDDDATQALDLAKQICPILAGKPPEVQSAALADLLAIWVSGHFMGGPEVLDQVLRDHVELVRKLIPHNVQRLKERFQC